MLNMQKLRLFAALQYREIAYTLAQIERLGLLSDSRYNHASVTILESSSTLFALEETILLPLRRRFPVTMILAYEMMSFHENSRATSGS